jgi:hypothetical protein
MYTSHTATSLYFLFYIVNGGNNMVTTEEEINKRIGNLSLTILGAVLKAESKEHDPKSTVWNIIGNIGKDMMENPDQYRVIIENIINLYEKNKRQ